MIWEATMGVMCRVARHCFGHVLAYQPHAGFAIVRLRRGCPRSYR
jgi:hypothetical protein